MATETESPIPLKAPFPWFGGKSRVASIVWPRLGDVRNYIEPFAGSAVMLLLRPHPPQIETINDKDCFVANFWRATQADPDAVVEYCDQPVFEVDLHARHRWLVLSDDSIAYRQRMRTDPTYFDARIAGWWAWGQCCWIGGGWCNTKWQNAGFVEGRTADGDVEERRPNINHSPNGIHAKRPDLQSSKGVAKSGTCEIRRQWLLSWFRELRDRTRLVRVCSGEWHRVCGSRSTTTRIGVTGIFLDPPYLGSIDGKASRDVSLYSEEDPHVAISVQQYCLQHGNDPRMRIALCGYEGEHNILERHGYTKISWRSQGGYGNRNKANLNRGRERIWFSPHCLPGLPRGEER